MYPSLPLPLTQPNRHTARAATRLARRQGPRGAVQSLPLRTHCMTIGQNVSHAKEIKVHISASHSVAARSLRPPPEGVANASRRAAPLRSACHLDRGMRSASILRLRLPRGKGKPERCKGQANPLLLARFLFSSSSFLMASLRAWARARARARVNESVRGFEGEGEGVHLQVGERALFGVGKG